MDGYSVPRAAVSSRTCLLRSSGHRECSAFVVCNLSWLPIAKPFHGRRSSERHIPTLIANLEQKDTSAFKLACNRQPNLIPEIRALFHMASAMQSRIGAAMCPAAAARSPVQPSCMRSVAAFGLRAAPRATSRSGAELSTSWLHFPERHRNKHEIEFIAGINTLVSI